MDYATADGPDGDERSQQRQAQTNERETEAQQTQSDAQHVQQHEQATTGLGAAADIDSDGHLVHKVQRRPTTTQKGSMRVELRGQGCVWGHVTVGNETRPCS
jgi:hypothetical protein